MEPDPKPLRRWIADLDSARFPVRQQATEALEKLGDQSEPALREKLTEKSPLEIRQRIERLLTLIEHQELDFETLRALRAVEVLEAVGSPQAKRY